MSKRQQECSVIRCYRVLDSSGIEYGVDFTGQVLVKVHDHPTIPDYIYLKQPEYDINGKPCNGVVSMNLSSLQEVQ